MSLSLAILFVCAIIINFFSAGSPLKRSPVSKKKHNGKPPPPWKPGMLDIHHLRVGPAVSSFLVFPDSTTMLIDAGDIDVQRKLPKLWKKGHKGLQIRPPYPDSSKTTAGWILDYIHHFWPRPEENPIDRVLDFALLTHFHSDHLGDLSPDSQKSKYGDWKLTGLTEVAESLPIDTLIDRGYPNYDFPMDLSEWPSSLLHNYQKFVSAASDGGKSPRVSNVEQFRVGSTTQISMKRHNELHNPTNGSAFAVRNIKSNLDVLNEEGEATRIEGEVFLKEKSWDENELSTAIVIEYGAFRYYEGADQESHHVLPSMSYRSLDTITPTAKAAGLVDVATANHHGRGTNKAYCDLVDPDVVIFQGVFSDQPLESSMERLTQPRTSRRGKRTLLVTDIFEERLTALGSLGHALAAKDGHVMVRVHPPGPTQNYEVYVLDEQRRTKAAFGPFKPRFLH